MIKDVSVETAESFFMIVQWCQEGTEDLDQGFSKGVPRNFWTVPREKVLGKCEHIKKGLCIKY